MTHKKKKPYKKVPRNKLKYPTFEVKRAVVNRREELEVDYLDKLNDEEKAFLNQFQEEWVCANFQNKDKLLDQSDTYRKERYNANNRRNRDLLINAKVRGQITRVESDAHLQHYLDVNETNTNETENALVDYIDEKNKKKD